MEKMRYGKDTYSTELLLNALKRHRLGGKKSDAGTQREWHFDSKRFMARKRKRGAFGEDNISHKKLQGGSKRDKEGKTIPQCLERQEMETVWKERLPKRRRMDLPKNAGRNKERTEAIKRQHHTRKMESSLLPLCSENKRGRSGRKTRLEKPDRPLECTFFSLRNRRKLWYSEKEAKQDKI